MAKAKMEVLCEDESWPIGILRPHIQSHVQLRVDDGWHLRGQVMHTHEGDGISGCVCRVFFTFVRPVRDGAPDDM